MYKYIDSKEKRGFGLVLILLLILIFATGSSYLSGILNKGKINSFSGESEFLGENNPKNLKFDYPASWIINSYDGGFGKNLGHLHVWITDPYYIFIPRSDLQIFWEEISLQSNQEAFDWLLRNTGISQEVELEAISIGDFELSSYGERKQASLRFTYVDIESTKYRQIHVVNFGDEIFVFIFESDNYDKEVEDTFSLIESSTKFE